MFRWKRTDCRAIKRKANRIFALGEGVWSGENGAGPVRSEFEDRSVSGKTHTSLGCVEVAGAVESQAPALTRNGAEDDPFSIWCELEDCAGRCGTVVIIRHDIGIARDVYGEPFKEKLSGAANGADMVTQVEFQRSPNLDGCRPQRFPAANRLPMLSKANPRGNNNPEA